MPQNDGTTTTPPANTPWSEGKGQGFWKGDGTRAMFRCVECGRENYHMNVLSGQCTWCPYDANAKEADDAGE